MANVTIYSTPTCVYCNMTKDFLKVHKIPYQEFNVASDLKAREDMVNKSHQLGVPVIDIDGTIIVGYDQPKIASALGLK